MKTIALALALLPVFAHSAAAKTKHLITVSVSQHPHFHRSGFDHIKKELAELHLVEWDAEFSPIEVQRYQGPGTYTHYQMLARVDAARVDALKAESGVIAVQPSLSPAVMAMAGRPQSLLVMIRLPDGALPGWLRMIESKYGYVTRVSSTMGYYRQLYALSGAFSAAQLEALAEEMWVVSVSPNSLAAPH